MVGSLLVDAGKRTQETGQIGDWSGNTHRAEVPCISRSLQVVARLTATLYNTHCHCFAKEVQAHAHEERSAWEITSGSANRLRCFPGICDARQLEQFGTYLLVELAGVARFLPSNNNLEVEGTDISPRFPLHPSTQPKF
jgi:hypothetical protein